MTKPPTGDHKYLVVMRPTSEAAFPAVELEAVAPCLFDEEGRVVVTGPLATDTYGQRVWARALTEEINRSPYALRKLEDSPFWTHHLVMRTTEESGGHFRDFVVRGRGLPETELEAVQHGLEWVELELAVWPPSPALDDLFKAGE